MAETIRVDPEVHGELWAYAMKLSLERRTRVSLSEAIRTLLEQEAQT